MPEQAIDAPEHPSRTEAAAARNDFDPALPPGFQPRRLFPWWHRLLYPGTGNDMAENPLFRALVRKAVATNSTPARILRRASLLRDNSGLRHLFMALHSTPTTAGDMVAGAVHAATLPRRTIRNAFGASTLEAFIWPFVAFVMLGMGLYYFSLEPQPAESRGTWAKAFSEATFNEGFPHLAFWTLTAGAAALMLAFMLAETCSWFALRRLFYLCRPRWESFQYIAELLLNPLALVVFLLICLVLFEPVRSLTVGTWSFLDRLWFGDILGILPAVGALSDVSYLFALFGFCLSLVGTAYVLMMFPRLAFQRSLTQRLQHELQEASETPTPRHDLPR